MKRYSGKNAWWFILIFIVFNLLPMIIFKNDDINYDIVLVITLSFYYLLFNIIIIPILIRNYIDLYDDYFIFYYGFSKRKVLIHNIRKIEKSRDMWSSSANSLDRIYIETRDDEFMISLKKNDKFLEVVTNRIHYLEF